MSGPLKASTMFRSWRVYYTHRWLKLCQCSWANLLMNKCASWCWVRYSDHSIDENEDSDFSDASCWAVCMALRSSHGVVFPAFARRLPLCSCESDLRSAAADVVQAALSVLDHRHFIRDLDSVWPSMKAVRSEFLGFGYKKDYRWWMFNIIFFATELWIQKCWCVLVYFSHEPARYSF